MGSQVSVPAARLLFELYFLSLLCGQFPSFSVSPDLFTFLLSWLGTYSEFTPISVCSLWRFPILPSDTADFLRVQFQGGPIQMGDTKGKQQFTGDI